MYGQPFGAGHAVPNFCRIEQAVRAVRRLLFLVVDHFFDDYFLVEPKCLAASAVGLSGAACNFFGLIIDKSQLPSTVWRALGAHFDMQAIRSSPRTRQTWYTYTAVPETVIQEWLPSGQQVHLV